MDATRRNFVALAAAAAAVPAVIAAAPAEEQCGVTQEMLDQAAGTLVMFGTTRAGCLGVDANQLILHALGDAMRLS